MEVEVLDRNFTRVRILDTFSSLIWNDVYCGYGDFEIEFPMGENSLAYIEEGYFLELADSDKTMIIEKIEIVTSFQDGNICRLSGRSLEAILERRVAMEKYTANNTPLQDAISTLLSQNLITPTNTKRTIPGFAMRFSEDPRIISQTVTMQVEIGDNIYTTIQKLCEERYLGFRVNRRDEKFLTFELYSGTDHSYDQTTNPWVVFSAQFENLEESNMAIDLTKHKNCMMITLNTTENIINPNGGSSETKVALDLTIGDDMEGFDRREIYGESNEQVDAIDKSTFGTAESRVDKIKYSSWVPVGFNSGQYQSDMAAWRERYAHILDTNPPRTYTETVSKPEGPYKNSDGSINSKYYNPELEGTSAAWLNTTTVTREENATERAQRLAYITHAAGSAPRREDYVTYGWEITDREGYNAALSAASAAINAEFKAAQLAALNYTKAKVLQWGASELAEYRTITNFDGKIDTNVNFLYRKDYQLGDVVQIVNEYHFNAKTRITSVMIAQDNSNGIIVRPQFESDDKAVVEFDLPDTTDFE